MLMCERSGVLAVNKGVSSHRSDTDNEGGATLPMRGREWSDTEMLTICGVCMCVCKCVVCACVCLCTKGTSKEESFITILMPHSAIRTLSSVTVMPVLLVSPPWCQTSFPWRRATQR